MKTVPAPEPPTTEPPRTRTKRAFNFWADPDLAQALEAYMASLPVVTKYTAHLEKALEEYLESRGFWQPPQS